MIEFKIRCSQISRIMTKSGKFTKGVESYCDDWVKEQLYNRKKEFTNKTTEKGNIVEDGSIDFVARVLGYGMLFKNQQYFENDYMTGTPDIIVPSETIDTKNSWDCFTFPLFEESLPCEDYYWQGQGYMELANRPQHRIVYVLSDTPINLIEREAFFYCRNNGYDDLDLDVYKKFEAKMTYKDISDNLKIKEFVVKKDDAKIRQIEDRVLECREYIDSKLKSIGYVSK